MDLLISRLAAARMLASVGGRKTAGNGEERNGGKVLNDDKRPARITSIIVRRLREFPTFVNLRTLI